MNIFLGFLALTLALAQDNVPAGCRHAPVKVANFDRVMTTINLKKTPASFSHILDANHSKYLASGFATQAQIDQMDREGQDYYLEYYGLNVSAGIPAPQYGSTARFVKDPHTGATVGLYIPYNLNDESYRLVFDSRHPERSCDWWRITNYGTIIQMLTDGFFPGGKAVGTRYYAAVPGFVGDILSHDYYHFTKKGADPLLPENMDRFLIRSQYPARQVLNSQGRTISVISLEVIDSQGKVGCGSITSNAFDNYDDPADVMLTTTNVMRWPCKGLNPLP